MNEIRRNQAIFNFVSQAPAKSIKQKSDTEQHKIDRPETILFARFAPVIRSKEPPNYEDND